MNNFECEQFLELTLSLGRQYVETGAEIKRVEDSLYRIYSAYGFENIEIYAITSLIVVTIKGPDGTHYTQSVRVTSGGTDLGRLEDINALIRYICTNKPNLVKLSDIINNPKKTKPKKLLKCIGYMLAAGGFAVFFGGDMLDGTAAAVIAIAVYFMDYNFKLRNINNVIYTFIASLVSGVIALIFTHFGFGNNVDKVMIGVIMLLIPGLLLVNSIKEMFNRDIVTGLYRFVEAVFVAVAIAGGFAVSVLLLGGVLK
ncbi:MAG: threonine/serine exporter family protein [Eubacterium sp.]|nr:threonine/serine exporter family protein [Eubacterium sp.]